MELISKEEVRRLICRDNDKYGYSDRFHEFTDEVLNNLSSAFEGMTCGEIIEALFPIERIYKEEYVEVVFKGQYHTTYFTFDFWNSTYRKGK